MGYISCTKKPAQIFFSKYCKYYQILGKHNDWAITESIDKGKYEEDYESVQKKLLDGLVNNTE